MDFYGYNQAFGDIKRDSSALRLAFGNASVSWRYAPYNGGVRLWEVRQSFRLADGAVVLNDAERRFALERLGAPPRATRVHVVSRYDRRDLPGLLAGSDILVFPSRFEGFNLALVECMACGVVPITTPVGAAPEVIRNGVNGFLLAANQPATAADIVKSLTRDQVRLLDLRAAAHASAQRYRWSSTGRETLSLYEAAIAGVT